MQGRHVIVTGGSRGLGAAMVLGLLDDGFKVSTCSRQRSGFIRELEVDHKDAGSFFWHACNIGEAEEVERFVDIACERGGGLYALVNNAGIAQTGILASFPNVESERIIRVNLLGAIQASRAAAKHLLRSGQGGRIVNISSIIGSRGYNGMSAYSASKAGLDGLTRSLARELGPRSICVNSIAPGYVETEMSATLTPAQLNQIIKRTPLGRLASESDILACLRFLLSDGASMITGQTILVDGGISC